MQMFTSRPFLVTLVLILLLPSCLGQKGGGIGRPGGNVSASAPSPRASAPQSTENAFDLYDVTRPPSAAQKQARNEEPPCFHWPLTPILSSKVNVAGLRTPEQARDDFVQGCEAVRKNAVGEAQKHLEQAVKLDPQFAAAWVLLGQMQREQKKPDKAVESCTHARGADPSYLPAYLCLADVAAHHEQWKEVAELTDQAAALHPVRAPGVFYYNSLAKFYLHQLPVAEASGLRALDESSGEQKAQMHFLLAKIYEQKGDRTAEAAQLRKFIDVAPHSPEAAAARRIVKQIEQEPRHASGKPPDN